MAQSLIANNNNLSYGVKRIIADTTEDITTLPYEAAPGSTAYVTGTKTAYVMDNNNTWVPRTTSSGGSSGGGDSDSGSGGGGNDNIYIWDGGDI